MKTTLGEYRKFCDALPSCYYFEECEDDFDDTTDDATPIRRDDAMARRLDNCETIA